MSSLAPTLQAFFTERLVRQLQASPKTVAAYRDAFRLLLAFAQQRTSKAPSRLDLADLDATLIGAFLDYLEYQRHNSVRTRNARLAAIHSFFGYAALVHPEHADIIQRVLAIPPKKFERAIVSFLTPEEIEALLASPDRSTHIGRRDYTLILLTVQTGLRVSELTGLRCGDIRLGTGACVICQGKGRKERATPLARPTAAVLTQWLRERQGAPEDPLFLSRRGGPLSTDAVAWLLDKHVAVARSQCQSLGTKRVTPHVLRHSCAMLMRSARIDVSVIALWLGHESIESTDMYMHADLAIKERALALLGPIGTPPKRYRPTDALLAFLDDL